MNYYRRFIGDYLRDTMHLTPAQDGFYNRLLDLYYTTEKPLSLDREKIYISVRANTEENKQDVNTILLQFFKFTKQGYRNQKADGEIKHYQSMVSRNKKNAKNAGRPKSSGFPVDSFSITQTGPTPEPTPTPDKELKPKPTPLFQRPDWILQDTWEGFEEMRKKIRAPLTDRARYGIVRELEKLRFEGHEPNQVLMRSVTNAWRGVFELPGGRSHGEVASKHEDRQRRVLEERRKALSGDRGFDDTDFRQLTSGGKPH